MRTDPGRPGPPSDRSWRESGPLISICVCTREEAGQIDALLDHLERLPGPWEVIVADGDSSDGTAARARWTVFAWTAIRWLYLLGVPPRRLAALYRRVR